ncbi:MAG: hypothetical protein H6R13_2228 [Proteobacteria bacterium]|nr:hypothetical protein [Pseudomonadota bacterium]
MSAGAWVLRGIWELAVVFVSVFAYFLLIAALVSLVIFPVLRGRIASAATNFFQGGLARIVGSGALASEGILLASRGVSSRLYRTRSFISRNPLIALGALLLLLLPSVLAFVIHRPAVFDFSEINATGDRQIAVLLNGEQLVPPPTLPPEMFTTKEVEMLRPDAVYASRNWALLQPDFVQRLLVVFKLMKERHGYEMVLIEGYRSPERQAQLFAQGPHVTQAGANMSYHQHGLAADSAFLRNGQVVISEKDPWAMRGYQLYGEIAEQVGFAWGGRWKMLDYGHVELRMPGTLARAR